MEGPDPRALLAEVGVKGEPTPADYERAAQLWRETTGGDFADLPESQRRWSAMLSRLVRKDERLFRCAACLDRGYLERDVEINGGFECRASYCQLCDIGLAAESGHWAEALTPAKVTRAGVKPRASDAVKAAFLRRLREHARGIDLRARVERLIASGVPGPEPSNKRERDRYETTDEP